MINYDTFKEIVEKIFMDYLPKEYQGMYLVTRQVEKVNQTLDGISLAGEDVKVSPTIYINHMYNHYTETEDLQETLSIAANTMVKAMKNAPDIVHSLDLDKSKENIVLQLINTEENKEMLAKMPNRPFLDLSIVYRWILSTGDEVTESTVINNNIANQLGLSEEQLFELAKENTKRILPPVIKNINDIIRDMLMRDEIQSEVADMMIEEIPPEQAMYVISNEKTLFGATSMLYEDKLYELAEEIGTNLYILPSSIHESIAVSADVREPEDLACMVTEVNMDKVSLEERLSNQVYYYDKDSRKLSLATDTPEKRLSTV